MDVKNTFVENQWKKGININPSFSDYGNNKAQIIDFGVFDHKGDLTNVIMKSKEFKLKMKVQFNEDITDPIFAFSIKDIRGTEITGTNTMLESVNTGLIRKNDIYEIEFTQNISLQGGDYLISFGCTGYENNDFVVYNRLYDIFNIHVIANKNSVGFFDMDSNIKVQKNERIGTSGQL